jgi:amino acid adenylation domain-containing protein
MVYATSLMGRFEEVARARADAVALVSSEGSCSYGELRGRATALARALRARGVARETPVGVCVPRSLSSMTAVVGVLLAGGAYVPIDPAYPEARQRAMASDAGLAVTVVDRRAAPPAAWWSREALVDLADLGATDGGDFAAIEASPGDLLNILYTSGSTGAPKGVCGTHGAMLNRLRWAWEALPFAAGDVIAHRSALSFVDAGPEMLSGLLAGVATAVVLPHEVSDLGRFVTSLHGHGVTRVTVVPSILAALVRSAGDLGRALPALRTWITSGEELTLPLLKAFRASHRTATLVNLYGSTELTGDATCAVFSPDTALSEEGVSIGTSMAGAELFVHDDRGRPAAEGELLVGGPVLARGYHQRPMDEAARFRHHPARPGARVFATGDLVRRRDDGSLVWLGRVDNLVKVRGVRVELEEVERCLRAGCDLAGDVCVVLAGDQLVACVTPADVDVDAVRAAAARLLPAAMVPSRVAAMAALPLSPNGKCDRRALAALCAEARRTITPERLPRGDTERAVAAVWRSLLRRDDVARDDTFAALGGDSLTLAEALLAYERLAMRGRVTMGLARDGALEAVARALDGDEAHVRPRYEEAIALSPLGDAGARDPAVVALFVEASRSAAICGATELPAVMDDARARAYIAANEGVVIRVNGEPAGAGCLQRHPNVGEGVRAPPGSVQLDEWILPRWRGRGILSEAGVWPLLADWMAQRFDHEVSVVWEDHAAMLAILRARGYTRLGRSYWTSTPEGDGTEGYCEVWLYDLRAHREAAR